MGQYRQWLHYRHVDQQLQSQKEQLTIALTRLREHVNDVDAYPLAADNCIVQALTFYTKTHSMPLETLVVAEQSIENGHHQQPEIISRALFDHSRLPDLEQLHEKTTHETVLPGRPTNVYAPLPPIPHQAIDLVSEDANALPDEHTPTEPQIALPWWLHKAALSATQSTSLDAQSIRTNRLVQRWLERWGRLEEQTQQATNANGQQSPPTQQERQQS